MTTTTFINYKHCLRRQLLLIIRIVLLMIKIVYEEDGKKKLGYAVNFVHVHCDVTTNYSCMYSCTLDYARMNEHHSKRVCTLRESPTCLQMHR